MCYLRISTYINREKVTHHSLRLINIHKRHFTTSDLTQSYILMKARDVKPSDELLKIIIFNVFLYLIEVKI